MLINRLKTAFLLALLSGLFLSIGALCGGFTGMTIALILAIALNFGAYFYSETIVLRAHKAVILDKQVHAWVYTIVQDLCRTMRIPVPKLWVISVGGPNAFATGRNPEHSSVAFSQEILTLLTPQELRGVIAHELSHIKNRDILISTIAATLAAAIGYSAQMLQHAALWGSFYGDRRRPSDKGSPIVALIVGVFVMPLVSMLVQLAISRSREYSADETGAYASKDPLALASALQKIEAYQHKACGQETVGEAAMASLYIICPFKGKSINSLFATHPATEKRVACLRKIADNLYAQRGKQYE